MPYAIFAAMRLFFFSIAVPPYARDMRPLRFTALYAATLTFFTLLADERALAQRARECSFASAFFADDLDVARDARRRGCSAAETLFIADFRTEPPPSYCRHRHRCDIIDR